MTDIERLHGDDPVVDFVAVLTAVTLEALVVLDPVDDDPARPDFVVRWANETAARYLQTSLEQLQGERYRTFFPDGGQLFDLLSATLADGVGRSGEIDIDLAETPIRRLEYRVVPAGDHLALSVIDRSEERAADELAARLEEMHRLGAQFSVAAAAILRPILDDGGEVIDFVFEYVNERSARYLGRTAEETNGRRITQLIPAGSQAFIGPATDCWRAQQAVLFDIDVSSTPLAADWLRFHIVPLAEVVIAHAIDISGARLEELALRASEERYRSLFETANEGIAVVDRQGTFLLANAAMAELLGTSEGELVGHHLSEFLDQSEYSAVASEAAEAARTGIPTPRRRVRMVRTDGTRWWGFAATSLVHDSSGEHIGYELMVVDVDAEFELELALRASEDRYRAVVDNAHAIILMTDANGTVEFLNREAERVLDADAEQLAGQPSIGLYAPEDRPILLGDFRALSEGEIGVRRRRFSFLTTRGERVPVVGSAVALRDDAGALTRLVIVAADITTLLAQENSRRELAAALAVAEQRERSRLASDLHDGPVQTLAALSMRLGAQQRAAAMDPEIIERAETIIRDTISQLRTLMFQLIPPDLDGQGVGFVLADRAAKLLGDDCAISLDDRWTQPPDATTARALFRIAHEAVVNVAKHAHADELRISLHETAHDYLIEIVDNGIGGDPGQFVASSPEHLGVRGMIDRARQVGGRCEIESEPGAGTTVFIRMPMMRRDA